jgi:hypothetical protein
VKIQRYLIPGYYLNSIHGGVIDGTIEELVADQHIAIYKLLKFVYCLLSHQKGKIANI